MGAQGEGSIKCFFLFDIDIFAEQNLQANPQNLIWICSCGLAVETFLVCEHTIKHSLPAHNFGDINEFN